MTVHIYQGRRRRARGNPMERTHHLHAQKQDDQRGEGDRRVPSAGGEGGPERVGATLRDILADLGRPVALRTELGPPGPEAPRDEVERVLVREPDRSMTLVRDPGAEACRLAGPNLGDGDLERGVTVIGRPERGARGDPGRRGVSGEE